MKTCFFLAVLATFGNFAVSQTSSDIAKSMNDTAKNAYLYFYPLITMEVTRLQSKLSGIKENAFGHLRTFPTATSLTIVRPNFDTLYSVAWVDLTQGPVHMTLPDTNNRYYLMPVMDMWTNVVASPGWRTTGTLFQTVLIFPPGCTANTSGIEYAEIINSPTPYAWIIGRTQTNGENDYAAVNALQNQFQLFPLPGTFGCPRITIPSLPASVASINMASGKPLNIVNNMTAQQFFEFAAHLWAIHKPRDDDDWSLVRAMSRVGIKKPTKKFDWSSLTTEQKATLDIGRAMGLNVIKAAATSAKTLVNGWAMNTANVGIFGSDYTLRAVTAAIGLGANHLSDAVYPTLIKDSAGNNLDGSKCYQLNFAANQTPPSMAYWSITMYDGQGFAVNNPINRYAIHSWDVDYGMKYNADQSLTIYIQSTQPSDVALKDNWLPSPASGLLGVTMRIYAPYDSVYTYQPPPAVPTTCL